jgi:HK97 family phage major capsid protein
VPLWLPSLTQGAPDTLLGAPLDESEYVPNTFTTGKYVGMYATSPTTGSSTR